MEQAWLLWRQEHEARQWHAACDGLLITPFRNPGRWGKPSSAEAEAAGAMARRLQRTAQAGTLPHEYAMWISGADGAITVAHPDMNWLRHYVTAHYTVAWNAV